MGDVTSTEAISTISAAHHALLSACDTVTEWDHLDCAPGWMLATIAGRLASVMTVVKAEVDRRVTAGEEDINDLPSERYRESLHAGILIPVGVDPDEYLAAFNLKLDRPADDLPTGGYL
jgi:hypothetical protein